MQDCFAQQSTSDQDPELGLTFNTLEQTPGEILYMPFWERGKAILLEEIKDTHPVKFRDDTGMIAIIEILVHVDTVTMFHQL